jgi:hypothetical protein
MTIGIIGSGAIGTAFARTLARAGIAATISNSRGPDSLKELIRTFVRPTCYGRGIVPMLRWLVPQNDMRFPHRHVSHLLTATLMSAHLL